MSVQSLEEYSKDQLIEELINRETFVGVVVYHRGDAKAGQLEPGEIVCTKSPPLTREGSEALLAVGKSLIPGMFDEQAATDVLKIRAEALPLRVDSGGVVRIGQGRVTLDLIVEQYENGMAPEEMVRAYDGLLLADAHAAIAYYLHHREEVKDYLKRRGAESAGLRQKIEAERPRLTRDQLMQRANNQEKQHAPAGQ